MSIFSGALVLGLQTQSRTYYWRPVWAFGLTLGLRPSTPWFFSGLWARTELHHWLSWGSGLQMADRGTSQPHNYVSRFLEQIFLPSFPPSLPSHWLSFSGEPWLVQPTPERRCHSRHLAQQFRGRHWRVACEVVRGMSSPRPGRSWQKWQRA